MHSDTEELWQQLHTGIHAFVSRRVRNPADVDDVVQRVFLQVHQGLGALRDEDRVHAWVYRTARHAIIDYYRGPVRRRELPSGSLADFAEAPLAEPIHTDEDERAAEQEFAACVQPLLGALPVVDLEALTLVDLQDMTQTDAAKRLHLSVSGMKSRVQRARRRFRAVVEDCCRLHLDRRGGIISYEPRAMAPCGCQACREITAQADGPGDEPARPSVSVTPRP